MIFWVSWSGRGNLVPFFAIGAILVGLVIAFFARAPGAGLGTVGPWPFAAGFMLVGALSFVLGLSLNRRSARTVDGPAPRRYCGLAMQWWSILMIGFGGLLLTDSESERPPSRSRPVPMETRLKD
jgi:drug/metabolite transporter (DMT)-like permease